MKRKVIGEYEFEWNKLSLYMDPFNKLLHNSVVKQMCKSGVTVKSRHSNISFRMTDLQFFGNFESYLREGTANKSFRFNYHQSLNSIETAVSKLSGKLLKDQKQSSIPEHASGSAAAAKGSRLHGVRNQISQVFESTYNEVFNVGAQPIRLQSIGDIAAKLEVFEHELQVIYKSTPLFTNTKMPLATAVKRYHSQKDKNIVDIFKPKEDVDHDTYVRDLTEEMCRGLKVDFQSDLSALVKELECCSRNRVPGFKFQLQVLRAFSEMRELFLLRKSLQYDLFSLRITLSVVLRKNRFEISSVFVQQKFTGGLVRGFEIFDPYRILILLRILTFRSTAEGSASAYVHQFMCFTNFFRTGNSKVPFKYQPKQSWILAQGDATSETVCLYRKRPRKHSTTRNPIEQACLSQIKLVSADRLAENLSAVPVTHGLIVNPIIKNRMLNEAFFAEGVLLQDRFKHLMVTNTQSVLKLEMPRAKHKSYSFLLHEEVSGLGPAYVTASVFLFLIRKPSAEERQMYSDTLAEHFFETLACRIAQLSENYFSESRISSLDASQDQQRFQGIARGGFKRPMHFSNIQRWGKLVQQLEEMNSMYQSPANKSVPGQLSETGSSSIFNNLETIKNRIKEKKKIILNCEELSFLFDIVPKTSKIKSYKVALSWKDIEAFFLTEELIQHLFPGAESLADIRKRLAKTPPKPLFVQVLRFLLSYCEILKFKLYRGPVFKLDKEKGDDWRSYLRNVYSKFGSSKGASHEQRTEAFNKKIAVVYSCVRRIESTYYIVTVVKNCLTKLHEVTFYCPKYCRTYVAMLKEASLASFQLKLLADVTRFLHSLGLADIGSAKVDTQAFDALWNETGGLKKPSCEIKLSKNEIFSMNSSPSSSSRDYDLSGLKADNGKPNPKLIRPIPVPRQLTKSSFSVGQLTRQSDKSDSLASYFKYPKKLSSFKELFRYFNQLCYHLKSTVLVRAMKKLEARIFPRKALKSFWLKQGDVYRERRDAKEGTSRGMQLSLRLAEFLLAHAQQIEMKVGAAQQFWDEVTSNCKLMYARVDGVPRLALKLGDEVQLLREIFGSVEFVTPDGHHISSRVYVAFNPPKPQASKEADLKQEERSEAERRELERRETERRETEKLIVEVPAYHPRSKPLFWRSTGRSPKSAST